MSQGGDTGVTLKCHTCHSQVTRMSLEGDNDVSQRRNYSQVLVTQGLTIRYKGNKKELNTQHLAVHFQQNAPNLRQIYEESTAYGVIVIQCVMSVFGTFGKSFGKLLL